MKPRLPAMLAACAALSCSSFHTLDSSVDASTPGDAQAGADAADRAVRDAGLDSSTVGDSGARDATSADAGREGAASSADGGTDASTDAPPPLDTACIAPWTSGMCAGRTATAVGSLTFTDDPRISMALSEGGALGLCYAEDSPDFLTRNLNYVSRETPTASVASGLCDLGMTDTTPACAIAGGSGTTLRTIAFDTSTGVLDYGEFQAGQVPTLNALGASTVSGYLTLGLVTVDATHTLAVVGNGTTGTIVSYLGALDGLGGATFANPVTVASGLSSNVPGSETFALLAAGATPALLVDVGPADAAGTRVDLDVWNGTRWTSTTVEGASLSSPIGWSPSLALADGGEVAAYFERGLDAGPDASASQLHLTTIVDGAAGPITTPLPRVSDDPQTPAVAVAVAVAPDGRTFVLYGTSADATHATLSLVRAESPLPGAPLVTDIVDDNLIASDLGSAQMVIEPSGRIDIAYMKQIAKSVYLAVLAP